MVLLGKHNNVCMMQVSFQGYGALRFEDPAYAAPTQ